MLIYIGRYTRHPGFNGPLSGASATSFGHFQPSCLLLRVQSGPRHKMSTIISSSKTSHGRSPIRLMSRCVGLQSFGEIAFCAVTATEQVKGFGARLMNWTKVSNESSSQALKSVLASEYVFAICLMSCRNSGRCHFHSGRTQRHWGCLFHVELLGVATANNAVC